VVLLNCQVGAGVSSATEVRPGMMDRVGHPAAAAFHPRLAGKRRFLVSAGNPIINDNLLHALSSLGTMASPPASNQWTSIRNRHNGYDVHHHDVPDGCNVTMAYAARSESAPSGMAPVPCLVRGRCARLLFTASRSVICARSVLILADVTALIGSLIWFQLEQGIEVCLPRINDRPNLPILKVSTKIMVLPWIRHHCHVREGFCVMDALISGTLAVICAAASGFSGRTPYPLPSANGCGPQFGERLVSIYSESGTNSRGTPTARDIVAFESTAPHWARRPSRLMRHRRSRIDCLGCWPAPAWTY